MNYNFTDDVRRVLAATREVAIELGHRHVEAAHMLLVLASERSPSTRRALEQAGADPDDLGRRVRERMKSSTVRTLGIGELPYTDDGRRALELAMEEAGEQNHPYVGSEHLLAALARDRKSMVGKLLAEVGLTVEDLRRAAWSRPSGEGAPGFRVAIDDASDRSIYEQIVAQVEEAVATGLLRAGDRLLPVRALADELDVAPGTVARAYGELERRGVVVTEGARGTRVADRAFAAASHGPARVEELAGLLRPVAVHAFHLGATAATLRAALEKAMQGIFREGEGEPV